MGILDTTEPRPSTAATEMLAITEVRAAMGILAMAAITIHLAAPGAPAALLIHMDTVTAVRAVTGVQAEATILMAIPDRALAAKGGTAGKEMLAATDVAEAQRGMVDTGDLVVTEDTEAPVGTNTIEVVEVTEVMEAMRAMKMAAVVDASTAAAVIIMQTLPPNKPAQVLGAA